MFKSICFVCGCLRNLLPWCVSTVMSAMMPTSPPILTVGIVQCLCYGLSYAKIGILVDNLLLLVNVFSKELEFSLIQPLAAASLLFCREDCILVVPQIISGVRRVLHARAAYATCVCCVCITRLIRTDCVAKRAFLLLCSCL